MIIKIKKAHGAVMPVYQTEQAAGADICAYLTEPLVIRAHERALVPTGLFMEIPNNYEVQLRPRSGNALKKGLTLLNTPGTIYADYRGEVKVLLYNASSEDVIINNGDRIAQAVAMPVIRATWQEAEQLSDTKRSDGGWGSTGEK